MASNERYALRWRDFESNIATAFKELRAESGFFDVVIGCSDSDGRTIMAHKVVLAACSVFFKQALLQYDHPKPFLYLQGVSFKNLSYILDFMYHGEVTVPKENLDSFLAVTGELKIKGLVSKDGSAIGKEEIKPTSGTDNPLFIAPQPKNSQDSKCDLSEEQLLDIKADDDDFDKYLNLSGMYKCQRCSFECKSKYRLDYHEKSIHDQAATEDSTALLIDGIGSFECNEETDDFTEDIKKMKDELSYLGEEEDINHSFDLSHKDKIEDEYTKSISTVPNSAIPSLKEETIGDDERDRKSPAVTLKLHLIKQHSDGTDRCTCTDCDRVFSSYRSAKQHLEIVHNDNPIFYECTICHKVIKSKQMFRIHALNKHEIRGKKILLTYGKEVGEAEYLKQKV